MSSSALPAKDARSLRTLRADRSRSTAKIPAANPMGRAGTLGVTAVSVKPKAVAAVHRVGAGRKNRTPSVGKKFDQGHTRKSERIQRLRIGSSRNAFEPFAAGAGQLSFLGFDHSFESGGDVGSTLVL